MINAGKSLDSP